MCVRDLTRTAWLTGVGAHVDGKQHEHHARTAFGTWGLEIKLAHAYDH